MSELCKPKVNCNYAKQLEKQIEALELEALEALEQEIKDMKGNYSGKSHAHKDEKKEQKKFGVSWSLSEVFTDGYAVSYELEGETLEETFYTLDSAIAFGELVEVVYKLQEENTKLKHEAMEERASYEAYLARLDQLVKDKDE